MASNNNNHESTAVETRNLAEDVSYTQEQPQASRSVEMSDLESKSAVGAATTSNTAMQTTEHNTESSFVPNGPIRTDTTTALAQALHPPEPSIVAAPNPMTRTQSTAIGPSSDQPLPLPKDGSETGPMLTLTLLLTNGARHPFKLDSKYLAKRNVDVSEGSPYDLSVYKLKELILREWRDEWETKPSSPSYIRLISFGKLLDDKSTLKDLRLNQDSANVMHMTIKPQDFIEDDDAKGAKAAYSGGRDDTESRSPGCRCIVM